MKAFNVNEIVNYGGDNVKIIGREYINNGDNGFFIYKIDVKHGDDYEYVNDFELDTGKILCPDCEMLSVSLNTGKCDFCEFSDDNIIGKHVCDECYGHRRLIQRRLGQINQIVCSKCGGKGYTF